MHKLITTCLIGLSFIGVAYAGIDCTTAQQQTTLNECAKNNYLAADKELNTKFKAIQQRLTDDTDIKNLLTQSQRAWISFRDAECIFSSSATAGGTIHPMLINDCKTRLTQERNKQLDEYLICEEGDLTCPVPPIE